MLKYSFNTYNPSSIFSNKFKCILFNIFNLKVIENHCYIKNQERICINNCLNACYKFKK